MGTDQMRDRVVRVLVEEGAKDAERDIAFYTERISANLRDGLPFDTWKQLLDEARGVKRFCATVMTTADNAMPDPIDLAKAAAEIADTPMALDSEPWADGIEQYQVESR